MNTETQLRALESVMHERLIDHEAAHAAAAMLLDLDVVEATAPFHTLDDLEHGDHDDDAGRVLITAPNDRDGLRKMALATLAPGSMTHTGRQAGR